MDLGSFDQCVGIVHKDTKSHYCMAKLAIAKPSQSNPFGADLRLGVCFPRTCSPKDINELLQNILRSKETFVEQCTNNDRRPFTLIDYVAM